MSESDAHDDMAERVAETVRRALAVVGPAESAARESVTVEQEISASAE